MSHWFSPEETACKDGCGLNNPDPALMRDLDDFRESMGHPVILNSLCRCKAHNAAEGGVEPNCHGPSPNDGFCKAADVSCTSDTYRFQIVTFFLGRGYRRIEISNLHVHVDRATDFRPWPWFGVKWIGANP